MSEPKVRREASLLTIIGLSHAEHVANRATRRVSDDDHPACQEAITDDSALSVVLSRVFNLDGRTFKDRHCVSEVETIVVGDNLRGSDGFIPCRGVRIWHQHYRKLKC
jgi:hypothetical protein